MSTAVERHLPGSGSPRPVGAAGQRALHLAGAYRLRPLSNPSLAF